MYSLRYLSARQLVQNEEATCKIMEFFPRQLYGILLKVAFRYKKSMLLQELVKNWPYPQLKVQMLLQICHQCMRTSKKCSDCQWAFPYNETSKNNFDDIIKGVVSYIKEIINDGSKTLPSRRLQQLDMTGLLGKYFLWNHKLMRLWASSISRAKICTLQQKIHDSENQEKSQVPETSTFPVELQVDFLVDLEVSLKSEEFLMAALQDNINSLLHLTCRDFYVDKLSVHDAAKFLVPLDPLVLRRIDLSKGQMKLMDIGWFMSQISIFQNMKSLKFPEFEFTNWWEEPSLKSQFDIFVTESNKLKHLTEIAFHNICLSDHLEYLLGGLLCSLQSLELSYCSLTNKDLTYLARSQHSTHLIKLNLIGNSIDQIEHVLELLKAASRSLVWLNMAFCGITDSKFYAALPSLCCCSKLSYLGLYGNHMTSTSVLTLLKQYQHKLPHLKAVAIPIFTDCCANLLDFRHLPRSMESYINARKFNSVLKELEELPRAEQESPINYTLNCNFPVIDYFDFQ
ncbi:leucine-rich repeat-containing protein 14-like [Sarcophilus harrisii]|uniref:Leucine-rich repeat-containing protein 14 n=1 Tax=Sarcophilus harrisii TaxID=9305 RepID=G3VN81_SARHA|nr:leucine-rich repeat-containing protein 14-like [Sarcophilus harrisii]